VPALANLFTQAPVARHVAHVVAGISPKRNLPGLARESFQRWFGRRGRPQQSADAPRVLLWPDTFNNYFHPETAIAAVEVLEAAGFRVLLPAGHVCCGRPLYDFGMLERAKGLLQQALEILEPEIIAGTPVVVLEPSCASVFRDELLNLFPDNEWAQRLSSQVFLLSEFLERQASQFSFPQVTANALVHGHCHHKSLMKMTDEEAVLRRLGIKYSMPAPGCCGMAGAFGFEKDTCDVSLAIGELELLPAVRRTPSDWLIIADGFSCREQIEQCTGRKTRHLAEVIRAGLREATKNS
jgi:Fe-S oxidoreductase